MSVTRRKSIFRDLRYKDVFGFVFDDQEKANYWLLKTRERFYNDVRAVNRIHSFIDFDEARYYFIGDGPYESIVSFEKIIMLPGECIYIILDDPERTKLDSYIESEEKE